MPSDDLVLNVRQIAQYPVASPVDPNSVLVIQSGGLGGPYQSVSVQALITAALTNTFAPVVVPHVTTQLLDTYSATIQFGDVTSLTAKSARIVDLELGQDPADDMAAVTRRYVDQAVARTVTSFNNRVGDILLNRSDVMAAGGAPIDNPMFTGAPQA